MKLVIFILLVIGSQESFCSTFGHPIQLLAVTENNKTVELAEGAIEKLFLTPEVLEREVVIVSISGALRKGKSFLLNYMLRYLYANYKTVSQSDNLINETNAEWLGDENEPLRGFPWKSSTNRETTGIMFWSDVFLHDTPNGVKMAIYLVDTQGLFDHYSTPTDNIRIFSLSALISSVQIMNLFSNIQEQDLEFLQYATEVARFTASDKAFQKLIFIIRDWNYPDDYEYGLEGGKQFLQSILKIRDFHSDELRKVREHIAKTFDTVEAFLMPNPGKFAMRNTSFDGRWKVIDEEFVEMMRELIPHILAPNNLIPKTVNGVTMKAFEFSIFIREYVELFKNESLPEAKTIYETTMDNQIQLLMSKSIEIYLQSIQLYQSKIQNETEIETLHELAKKISLKYFQDEKKFGNENEILKYKNELDEKLEMAYHEWKPVTEKFLNDIKQTQLESEEQKAQIENAQKKIAKAKQEINLIDESYEEIQQQLKDQKNDSQVEELRKKLKEIEREKELYMEYHRKSTYELELSRRREHELAHQLMIAKHYTEQQVKLKADEIRSGEKFLKIIEGIEIFFTSFFNEIGNIFGNLIG